MTEVKVVDVIFLDIDGVLLPFGDGLTRSTIASKDHTGSQIQTDKGDDHSFTDGCIFPNRTMHALTMLLQRLSSVSIELPSTQATAAEFKPLIEKIITSSNLGAKSDTNREFTGTSRRTIKIAEKNTSRGNDDTKTHATSFKGIKGYPVFVLSSTWRARPEFIQDILSSFRAYVRRSNDVSSQILWEPHLHSFFDITDPFYHSSRHDEIQKWVKTNVHAATCQTAECQYRQKQQRKQRFFSATRKFVVRSWIALDDEDLVDVKLDSMKHVIQTESSVGLTLHHVDLAVDLVRDQIREFYGVGDDG